MPKASRDGVWLYYQEAGSGPGAMVFIHGATCDHTFLQPQYDHFRNTHRVLALDLRGHGQSDKPRQKYTMAGFAQDVAWLCQELGIKKAALVGHSLGGTVALKLAGLFPELVSAVAALDSTVISSRERLEKILPALLARLRQPDYLAAFCTYFEAAFEPADDLQRKAAILEKMCAAPQHVIISLFEEFMAWDGVEAVKDLKAPFLYIAATRWRTDQNLLKELCPQLIAAQVVAAGHFLQLEVPEQVNPMLARFFNCQGI